MVTDTNRRGFLKTSGAAMAGATLASPAAAAISAPASNERIQVALIGCGGRGSGLIQGFALADNCEVIAVCDPDTERASRLATAVSGAAGNRRPDVHGDLRDVLDRSDVDAVVIATPDHWHSPAAILACDAGKHVYVEKPCSHNLREGRLLVDAARRNHRIVQHGTQSRSMQLIADAIQLLREGIIGDVLVAKAWNVQQRNNIGHDQPSDPPPGVDYDMWLGPAPFVPFQKNRFHYNWHWWFAFGTGDMGNDGVHELDYARWGLGVETHPTRISGFGNKLYFDDDQQFPDTQAITFEYPGDDVVGDRRLLIWEMRIWSGNYPHNIDNGVEFYGTGGRMVLTKRGKMQIFDSSRKAIPARLRNPQRPVMDHHLDFLDAIGSNRKPNADIEIGHLSASLCHLGNIVTRVNRTLEFDPQTEQTVGDSEARQLLSRTYRENHWAVPQGA